MVSAICKTMTSISASSLTTIAGFLALCAMRLTLGRDIGVVMAKGVVLGVICTVVILPSLILTFDKWVEKYKHRTVIPKLKKLSYFVSNHAVPIVVVFILIIIPFAIAQNKTTVYYTLFDSLPQDLTGIVGTNKLGEDFGMTTSHFILVHDDLTATQVSDLCDDLKDVDGITQVVSLESSITGPGFDTFCPRRHGDLLQSGGYKLILANSSYETGTDAINNQLTEMNDLIKAADPNGVITGEGAMTKDLIEVADVDFRSVSVIASPSQAVFLIIAISFRSAPFRCFWWPPSKVAIMINMGIPYFTGTTLPFDGQHRHRHHPARRNGGLRHPDDHLIQAGTQKDDLRSKMEELFQQVDSVTIPDTSGIRNQLAGGVQQVFDTAVYGASSATAQNVSSGIREGCKEAAAGAISAVLNSASQASAEDAAAQYNDALSGILQSQVEAGALSEDAMNAILAEMSGVSVSPPADQSGLAGQCIAAVNASIDQNVGVDPDAVAQQITAGMSGAREQAVSQVVSAVPDLTPPNSIRCWMNSRTCPERPLQCWTLWMF